jgi:hypothetical protein
MKKPRAEPKREFEVHSVIRPLLLAPGSTSGRLPRRLRHEFHAVYMATDPYVVSEPDRAGLQELCNRYHFVAQLPPYVC